MPMKNMDILPVNDNIYDVFIPFVVCFIANVRQYIVKVGYLLTMIAKINKREISISSQFLHPVNFFGSSD